MWLLLKLFIIFKPVICSWAEILGYFKLHVSYLMCKYLTSSKKKWYGSLQQWMPEFVASVWCFSCAYSSLSCHTWDCTTTSPVSPITDLMHSFISLVWEQPVPSGDPSLPDRWQMFYGGLVSNQTASTFKLPQTAFWSRSTDVMLAQNVVCVHICRS